MLALLTWDAVENEVFEEPPQAARAKLTTTRIDVIRANLHLLQ